MQKEKRKLVLAKEDYAIIMANMKGNLSKISFNSKEAVNLETEFKGAKLVGRKNLPDGIVRLNSFVTVKDDKDGKLRQFTVVAPDSVDIRQKKISVLSPIGTALIGYKKGGTVSWRTHDGRKTFTIMDVSNATA